MFYYNLVKLIFIDLFLIVFLIFFLILSNLKFFLTFFTYSEYFWIFLFVLSLSLSSFLNDPRIIIMSFFILFLATVELITVSLFLLLKIK